MSQESLEAVLVIFLGTTIEAQTSFGMSMHFSVGTKDGTRTETSLHSLLGTKEQVSTGILDVV